jgi:hypothetical protein
MCLVLEPKRALYLYPDGCSAWSTVLPTPGQIVEFRPDALDFLPGPGCAPSEVPPRKHSAGSGKGTPDVPDLIRLALIVAALGHLLLAVT